MSRLSYIQHKITDPESARRRILGWQMEGEKVVFTNGCFDILHKGHVTYLAKAAGLGDRLVLCVNSDDSVRRLNKGPERPINNEDARALVLASLGFVDVVVIFDEDTPLEKIQLLQPDILAKGADYDPEVTDPTDKRYIVGSKEVKAAGGSVQVIAFEEGFSTTNIIDKLKK